MGRLKEGWTAVVVAVVALLLPATQLQGKGLLLCFESIETRTKEKMELYVTAIGHIRPFLCFVLKIFFFLFLLMFDKIEK